MKQATYDVSNLGHFGLASKAYLHFTSPIRRYPDLVVHRVVHAALEKSEKDRKKALAVAANPEALVEAALASSTAERRAMECEREIVDIYRCFYMIDRIGERFEGTVSAFVGAGAFVNLDNPFVDVMVKLEDLGGDWQIEDDGLMATSGRSGEAIRLGDAMLVDVTDVAILRRSIYARRVGAGGRSEKQRGFDPRDGAPRFGKKKGKTGSWANDKREGGGDDRRGGRNKGGPGPARARKAKGKGKGGGPGGGSGSTFGGGRNPKGSKGKTKSKGGRRR
jgi:ribonuclease R